MITPRELEKAIGQAKATGVVRDLKRRDLELQVARSSVMTKNPVEYRTYVGDSVSGPIYTVSGRSKLQF